MNKKIRSTGILVFCALCGIYTAQSFCVGGYEVVAEGKTIGFVENVGEVEKITRKLENEIETVYGEDAGIDDKITFVEKTSLKNNITTENELEKNISELSDNLTKAYILMVDGKDTIIMNSYDEMTEVLYNVKLQYLMDNAKNEFSEELTYKNEYVAKAKIMDVSDGIEYFGQNKLLNVKTTLVSEYQGTIAFDTLEEKDDTMYKGSTQTIREGEIGESKIRAEVIYINGEETQRKILEENIIKEPVDEIIRVGTLEPPEDYGTGSFIKPLEGRFTSGFGPRWGRMHNGIDIAVPVGTGVKASDNGKVVFAGEKGSYGILVKIDHGNGYMTYYAHLSEIDVQVGDCVEKGEVIAKSGNTGNSTGPHLHFEIRYNNKPQNPLTYIEK